ncbi:MAG: DUF5652 family protein [Candidatus Omnitrophota bacterium]
MDRVNLWIILAIIWTLPWKGVALWKSARNRQKVWFICLLLLNTLAVLEVTYLLWFQKDRNLKSKEDSEAKEKS